jgi:hypothetical protein
LPSLTSAESKARWKPSGVSMPSWSSAERWSCPCTVMSGARAPAAVRDFTPAARASFLGGVMHRPRNTMGGARSSNLTCGGRGSEGYMSMYGDKECQGARSSDLSGDRGSGSGAKRRQEGLNAAPGNGAGNRDRARTKQTIGEEREIILTRRVLVLNRR